MTVGQFLPSAIIKLRTTGDPTARLDCLVLLEDCLRVSRAQLLAHPEMPLTSTQLRWLEHRVTQRECHEPLAYIRGHAPFYGREFLVNRHTLIPRPETETMIDFVVQQTIPKKPSVRLADIGCGSGCIGITLALELPNAQVMLYDNSAEALSVARKNAAQHAVHMSVRKSDLLQRVVAVDIMIANLPYVPDDFSVDPTIRFEPQQAIFAGADGLAVYRRFWHQLTERADRPAVIFTESLPPQHDALAKLAGQAGYHLTETRDFIQRFQI